MNETELIRAAQQGDLLAFNRLVLDLQETIFNLAYRVLCDEAAAEDATHKTFLCAYQDLRRFHKGSFRTWLCQKAIQVCRQKLRQNGRSSLHSFRKSTAGQDAIVQRCLNSLPADIRLALVLIDMEGFNYGEAAEILEVSSSAVQSQLALARQQMLDQMAVFSAV